MKDTKVANAGTFTIQHEDHTLGSLLRMYVLFATLPSRCTPFSCDRQLLNAPKVLYAGYRIPHPLVNYIEIKIQTNNQSDPETEFLEALNLLSKQTLQLERNFQSELDKFKHKK